VGIHRLGPIVLAVLLSFAPLVATAADLRFFQLGTGPSGGSRFPLGGLIASALSNPPGSRQCEQGGSCGPPGLVAVARTSAGSVANVEALAEGRVDAALVDAETAMAAIGGSDEFHAKPIANLRGIAMLYPESLHLVVRKGAGIHGVRDLKGRKLAIDPAALGPSHLLLAAWGLAAKQVKRSVVAPAAALAALAAGRADAVLTIGAWPIAAIAELARSTAIDLLPLAGPEAEGLCARTPFLTRGEIGDHVYEGVTGPVATLEIGIALLTTAEQDADLVAGITRALWQPATLELLTEGNIHGGRVRLDAAALAHIGIPLHPGAASAGATGTLGK